MNRMRFSDSSGGPIYYELPVNPTSVSFEKGDIYTLQAIKDGVPVRQKPLWDARVRTMTWRGLRKGFTLADNMRTVLRGYVGEEKWLKEWQTGTFDQWYKIRIVDFQEVVRVGSPVVIMDCTLSFIIADTTWDRF